MMLLLWITMLLLWIASNCAEGSRLPRRILLDTDVDTDDFFALLYLLKLNRSEFELKVSSIFFFA